MRRIIILLALLTLSIKCTPSFAKASVGLSYMYININDPDFEYIDKYEVIKSPKDQLNNINLSYSVFYDNSFNVSFSTNRLFNNKLSRSVRRKTDNTVFQSNTETVIDSLAIGYKINRFNPALVLSNVGVKKSLYYNGNQVGFEKNSTIVGGLNLGYFATKNFLPSVTYIMPNKELDLKGAYSININYFF